MTRTRLAAGTVLVVLCTWPVATRAQQAAAFALAGAAPQAFTVLDAQPLETVGTVRGAPFTADAVTEFTQILSDGNRIERVFRTSIARDSRGRTRREQEIALLGPLTPLNDTPPRVVTINDPDTGINYTLNDQQRSAVRNQVMVHVSTEQGARTAVSVTPEALPTGAARVDGPRFVEADQARIGWTAQDGGAFAFTAIAGQVVLGLPFEAAAATPGMAVQSLGTSVVEGVTADGMRTTMTIPAGAVGNVLPIAVVTERWFSKELQMAVQITRRDPRTGDTVYRLTNIVRAEPPPDLFVVPSDYETHDATTAFHTKIRESAAPERPR